MHLPVMRPMSPGILQEGGRPTWLPMVRFDGYEENDGKDSFTTTTLNLGYYFTQSIKGFVEYRESTIRLPVLMRVHDQPFS